MAIPDPEFGNEDMDGDWENEVGIDPHEYYQAHGVYHFRDLDQMGDAVIRMMNELSSFCEGFYEYCQMQEEEKVKFGREMACKKFQILEVLN